MTLIKHNITYVLQAQSIVKKHKHVQRRYFYYALYKSMLLSYLQTYSLTFKQYYAVLHYDTLITKSIYFIEHYYCTLQILDTYLLIDVLTSLFTLKYLLP